MAAPHVCCLCSRQHRHGAKTFDRSRTKCAKNCLYKPPVTRPFPWVGKGSCCVCGSVTPRGTLKCANREKCLTRSLNSLKRLPFDDATQRRWYDEAMAVAA